MNVSDLQSLIYSTAGIGSTTSAGSMTSVGNANTKEVSTSGQNVNAFSEALSEEVGKLTESYKEKAAGEVEDNKKVADFKKLAAALDGSVLDTVIKNASDSDLQALSNDLLGSSGGREVLSKLMEGHFNSIAMSDSDDDDEKDVLNDTVDSYNQTVSETQALLDSLEKVSAGMQTEK